MRVDGTAELFSRHATNLTGCFPEITDALVSALARTAILDGEIVALDRHARPSFDLIQRRMRRSRPPAHLLAAVPATFFVYLDSCAWAAAAGAVHRLLVDP